MWRRFCSSVPKSSSTARHGANVGDLEAATGTRSRQLLVEDAAGAPAVRPWPPYSRGNADAGQPGVEQHAAAARGRGRPRPAPPRRSPDVREQAIGSRGRPAAGSSRDRRRGPAAGSRSSGSIVARRSVAHAAAVLGRSTMSASRCAVLGRGAVAARGRRRGPAQEQVQVVLEGDADAAVELHAVLEQLGAVLRRCTPWPR